MTLSIDLSSGFYGVGASVDVFLSGHRVASHKTQSGKTKYVENDIRRSVLLWELSSKWRGDKTGERYLFILKDGSPKQLVNALLHDTSSRPKLPMEAEGRVVRLDPTESVTRFLDSTWKSNLLDGVVLDGHYTITLHQEKDLSWRGPIKIESIIEVVELSTGKKYRESHMIPDYSRGDRFEHHLGYKIKYVWPIKDGVLRIETDNKIVSIDLRWLK